MRFRFLAGFLVVFALSTGTGFSQTFTGTLDGYWSYNSNQPNYGTPLKRTNDYRAFDIRDQSFALNYGELAVDYKPNNVGVRVDIGFGDAAEVVNSGEANIWRHIQQAYITGTHKKLTLDFGKFVTPIGAEVIETKDNWNYTRGLLFTYAVPFYHMGARATYAATDKVSLAGYVVNGWNNVQDNNTSKSFGFSGTFKVDPKVTVSTNILTGRENPMTNASRTLLDGIVTVEATKSLTLMANYDFGRDWANGPVIGTRGPEGDWQGLAAYAKLKVNDKMTLSTRWETFEDRAGTMTGVAQDMQSYTGTAMFPWEGATFWTEFRRDISNKASFHTSRQGVFGPSTTLTDHQNTFTLGITYAFEKKAK